MSVRRLLWESTKSRVFSQRLPLETRMPSAMKSGRLGISEFVIWHRRLRSNVETRACRWCLAVATVVRVAGLVVRGL